MSENTQPMVVPIRSPWRNILLDALTHTQQRLLMVCPYIKEDVVTAMKQALLTGVSERKNGLAVRVMTRVNPDDLLSGSSDIAALQQLLAWSVELPDYRVEMRAVPNVHAKVWVCDTDLAIVGSGNATSSGLDSNLEYGLAVYDAQLIGQILHDWQQWWEQAECVEYEALEKIREDLQKVKQSDAMRQSQLHKERLQQELKTIPSLGRRIMFKKEKQPASPVVKEQSEPIYAQPSDQLTASTQAYTIATPGDLTKTAFSQEAIDIPVIDFWRALCWVLPFDEETDGMIDSNAHPDASLKLAWRAVPADHQELHFIWADGKRYSQASLLARNVALPQSWAVTLNSEQLHLFGEMLQRLKREQFFTKRAEQHVHLLFHTEQYATLSITYLHNPANLWSAEAMVIPCAQSGIPGTFPKLRRPLSHITVSHERLRATLTTLKQEWESTHPQSEKLALIELSFDTPDATANLTLSTGQIEAPTTHVVEGTDCVIAGPGIKLRLDYEAVSQVVANTQEQVECWQLQVGRNAETVQFIPEPAFFSDTVLLWRHELRSV